MLTHIQVYVCVSMCRSVHTNSTCIDVGSVYLTNEDILYAIFQAMCSCLENPRGRGAWWAGVYGVAQSQTPLK